MDINPDVLRHIELLFGSIGVILGLFFSSFLFITRKNQPRANLFLATYLLAFSLRIGKSLFYNYFPIDPVIRNIFLGVLLAIGPSLFFYTKLLVKPTTSIKNKTVLLHFAPMLLVIAFSWLIPNNNTLTATFFYLSYIAHIVLYTSYSLYWLKSQNGMEINKEQKVVKWLYYFLSITLFIVITYLLISLGVIPYYLGMAFLFSIVVIFFAIWALKNPFLFKPYSSKYSNSNLTSSQVLSLSKKLNDLMQSEKLYLDSDITLSKLSNALGISSKQLSQVINQTEHINYSQYITKYRVNEAKSILEQPKYQGFKIASIAYDCGFNSISSFNTAFKKLTGQTAAAYRKAHLR